jgi:hypothetical protein
MKHKLKFEITFPDMDKADEREAKLNLINSDIKTEIESEYPIPTPVEKSIVILGELEYELSEIRYKLEADYYTTICYVVDANYLLNQRRKDDEEKYKRMMKILKS